MIDNNQFLYKFINNFLDGDNVDLELVKLVQKQFNKIINNKIQDFVRTCSKCKNEYSFQEEFKYKNTYLCKTCLKECQNKRYERIKNETIVCECGQIIKKYSQRSHLKTKKHEIQLKCKMFLMT